jgi:UTP--glucose-1-phosphate uridylyltransferase
MSSSVNRFVSSSVPLAMESAKQAIQQKMANAEVSEAAQRAFLYQFDKLVAEDSGLIPEESIKPVASLPCFDSSVSESASDELRRKTVILKLNGGLGTGMGLETAKSLLMVRDGLSFLDIIVRQVLAQRRDISSELTLLWMNSFSTSADTRAALERYRELGAPDKSELLQNKVPKLDAESLFPISWPANEQLEWCPPGHGDLYPSLLGSGFLERLIAEGKEYLFVSNADNLGASLDVELLRLFEKSETPFMMEVTRRTEADRKGGHLAIRRGDDRFLLRELAQCPEPDLDAFQDVSRHPYFNTNSIWLRLQALADLLEQSGGLLPLPMIRNRKNVDPRDKQSPEVYQLETAMGAGIQCFAGSQAIEVPRERFAPVKTTSDLLGIRSDAYELDSQYRLRLRPERNGVPPIIRLSESYKLVDGMEELVRQGVPSIIECCSLEIAGPVRFASGVRVVGDVKFINRGETTKTIEAGVYQDCELEL